MGSAEFAEEAYGSLFVASIARNGMLAVPALLGRPCDNLRKSGTYVPVIQTREIHVVGFVLRCM